MFPLIVLLISSVIDYRYHIIPNTTSFLLFGYSILFAKRNGFPLKIPIILAVTTFLIIFFLVIIAEKISKQYVMGGGDIKLLASICSCVGIYKMSIILFYVSVELLIVYIFQGKQRELVALCPFIFAGYIVSCFF